MTTIGFLRAILAVLVFTSAAPLQAQDLKIAIATEPSALDPLFRLNGPDERPVDDTTWESHPRQAMETAINDVAVVPLYCVGAAWAFRKGLAYTGRTDQYTLAQEVTRAP